MSVLWAGCRQIAPGETSKLWGRSSPQSLPARGDLSFHKEHEASCQQGLFLWSYDLRAFCAGFWPSWIARHLRTPEARGYSEGEGGHCFGNYLIIFNQTVSQEAFRDYTKNDALGERVKRTYTEMHTKQVPIFLGLTKCLQTMAFVMEKHEKWLKFNHMEATIMEALDMLNELASSRVQTCFTAALKGWRKWSRPGPAEHCACLPNCREDPPRAPWQGMVPPHRPHSRSWWVAQWFWGPCVDINSSAGKIMAFYGEPQWAVVGDTFPVGCKPQPSIVFGEESFENNPDVNDSRCPQSIIGSPRYLNDQVQQQARHLQRRLWHWECDDELGPRRIPLSRELFRHNVRLLLKLRFCRCWWTTWQKWEPPFPREACGRSGASGTPIMLSGFTLATRGTLGGTTTTSPSHKMRRWWSGWRSSISLTSTQRAPRCLTSRHWSLITR